jgi:hypothetical protein
MADKSSTGASAPPARGALEGGELPPRHLGLATTGRWAADAPVIAAVGDHSPIVVILRA